MSFAEALWLAPRRVVKRKGRQFIKVVAEVVSRQSLIEDRPVHDAGAFPFISAIEANWTKIRAELEHQLKHRKSAPQTADKMLDEVAPPG
jgi:hypothetical protein